MIQLAGGVATTLGAVTVYRSLHGVFASTDEGVIKHPWSAPGTFSDWRITGTTAPGSGKSYTFTLRINGSDTSVVVTIADGAIVGTSSESVAIAAGDLVSWRQDPSGTPTEAGITSFTYSFTGDTTAESGYAQTHLLLTDTSARYFSLLGGSTASDRIDVLSAPGTLTRWDLRLSVAPGTGDTRDFVIYKNGVAQDGAGGTPDTRISIGETAVTGTASFSLSLAGGDTIYGGATGTGSPAFARVGVSVAVTSTTDGHWNVCGTSDDAMSASATRYSTPVNGVWLWNTTDALAPPLVVWATAAILSQCYVVLTGTPGAGKSYTIDARVNAASPSSTLSVSIADAATTGNDTTKDRKSTRLNSSHSQISY